MFMVGGCVCCCWPHTTTLWRCANRSGNSGVGAEDYSYTPAGYFPQKYLKMNSFIR